MILKRIFLIIFTLIALLCLAGLIAYLMSSNVCTDKSPTPGDLMKSITYCEYGGPQVLKFGDVAKPIPNDDELLVKVHAAGVNPLDWHFMRGAPYVIRLFAGMRYPQDTKMGVDFAGTVEAVGKNVTQFQPGDEVFGGRNGALSEYVTVRAGGSVIGKPSNISFAQAASVPVAAITALQALRDKGDVQAGQSVLINGASGGVGTFAVQIAKSFGAEVTGVSSTRNLELVESLGASYTIDYTRENYTEGDKRYDLILDCVGNHSLLDQRRVLKPGGKIVMVGDSNTGNWIGPFLGPIAALVLSPLLDEEFIGLLAETTQQDLSALSDLMQASEVTPVIDRKYALSEASQAIAYIEVGHARGKVVVTVD